MTGEEENKVLAQLWVEALNKQDLDKIDEVMASDLIWHGSTSYESSVGVGFFKDRFAAFVKTFPDLHVTIRDQVASGDKVVTRYTVQATHRGAMGRIGPSGKKVEWNGINVFRVDKGKIAEEWWSEDILGLMQQIGAVPSPLW